MAMKDFLQMKSKLKSPQIRQWVHPAKGGDDYYYRTKFSSKALDKALSEKPRKTFEGYVEAPLVAYAGKEFTPKEFVKKYPKFKPFMQRRIEREARGLPAVHHKKSSAPKSVWGAWFG